MHFSKGLSGGDTHSGPVEKSRRKPWVAIMVRLLIVDDSALMRKCLVGVFEATGDYDIRTARNGADALTELKTFKPDVITLDINMPEMDGLTCLSHIMARRPIILLSRDCNSST